MKGAKKKKADTKLTVKRTAPKGKAPKDPNKPKRPASAFFVFMEAFKEENLTINSVAANEPFVAKAEQRKIAGISSVQSVISNNDIITEILLKLPVLSLVLFKSVSKHWYSLIKEANITFCPNLDPLSGLFLKKISYKNYCESFSYDFVSLDTRISIYRSSLLATNFTFGPEVRHKSDDVKILDSCNGLLLCRTYSEGKIFKLDIMNEHPVLTAFQTPLTLDVKFHYGWLFESRGYLLIVGMENACSQHFTIYKKRNVYSEWSVKYIVNLDEIINPFPKRWSECSNVFCIVLGEREEDSFLLMQLDQKVVQYKIVSKTPITISDLGRNENLSSCSQFIPSFANV
uniref:F-box protein At5g07610-like n=1 Tax=Tanacetum cinerariifolium TaxID=118510 RepID=A0A699HAG2_TANCI|nr:F-box protein At5g07610-like [Tanacetum cinerariifolium]